MPIDDPWEGSANVGGRSRGLSRPLPLAPILAGILALGIGVTVVMVAMKIVNFRSAGQSTASANAENDEVDLHRRLITFAGQFLMNYYNYSYTLYPQAVQRAEAMMTPSFQTAFSNHALDQNFIQLLNAKQVSTDAFSVSPNSYQFADAGKTHYLQLSGTMTYTTGINGAQAQWPTTVNLEVLESSAGFLVNNVQRIR